MSNNFDTQIIQILQSDAVKLSWTHLAAFPQPINCGAMGKIGSQVAQQGNQGIQGQFGIQGCYGSQGYYGSQGSIGTTGPYGTYTKNGKTYRKQTVPRTEMPETLLFTITCLDQNKVFSSLSFLINQFMEPATERVNIVDVAYVPPRPIARPTRLKEEFLSVYESKKAAYETRKAKVDLLIAMAVEYGAFFEEGYDVSTRGELIMPKEAYEEYGPQTETNGEIKILCRKTSKIYKLLDSAGFIQQYCPEGYRRGDSYSVNGGPMHTQPIEEVLVQ